MSYITAFVFGIILDEVLILNKQTTENLTGIKRNACKLTESALKMQIGLLVTFSGEGNDSHGPFICLNH